jgi:hypothetical protein
MAHSISYIETSAKDEINIDQLIELLLNLALNRRRPVTSSSYFFDSDATTSKKNNFNNFENNQNLSTVGRSISRSNSENSINPGEQCDYPFETEKENNSFKSDCSSMIDCFYDPFDPNLMNEEVSPSSLNDSDEGDHSEYSDTESDTEESEPDYNSNDSIDNNSKEGVSVKIVTNIKNTTNGFPSMEEGEEKADEDNGEESPLSGSGGKYHYNPSKTRTSGCGIRCVIS